MIVEGLLKRVKWAMKSEKGFSLIETMVALAIMGLVAVGFLSGLATSSRAVIIAKEQTTAQSLAKSQMEYIKEQPYDGVNNPPVYNYISDIPATYVVHYTATRLDPEGDGNADDDGIQKIVVTVERNGKTLVRLEDYKVDR